MGAAKGVTNAATVGDSRSGGRRAPRPIRNGLSAVFSTLLSGVLTSHFALTADAQHSSAPDHVAAGRTLALLACTGCHVVAPDQPFAPVLRGSTPPPDFHSIANTPTTSADSLRKYLLTLPAIPALTSPQKMANPDLTSDELEDIVAFIMSLRVRSTDNAANARPTSGR
jgi:cytochrome c1